MPSITTQNVAAAVATIVQNPTPPPPAAQTSSSQAAQQIIKASQVAAVEQTHRARRKDESRSPQVPKRAEGAFQSQPQKSRSAGRKKTRTSEEEESLPDPKSGMDVVA